MVSKQEKFSFKKFALSGWGAFTLGAVLGMLVFAAIYGWSVIWPWNIDWIWHSVTHDTAQHYLGWAFFAADSRGGTINGLAYPYGLSLTFMDVIPLLAFPAKWLGLGADIQYFGLWTVGCFMLMGGLSAVLLRRLWLRVFRNRYSVTGLIFSGIGSLIFVFSPMLIARTLYHPALAAQWLILLAFIVIWDSNTKRITDRFVLVWSGLLALSVLIHPYFLPMMGAMMLISLVRAYPIIKREAHQLIDIKIDTKQRKIRWHRESHRVIFTLILSITVPVAVAGALFWAIGGFSLGGGAEVYDLPEKGFNLLSFINSLGYSALIPAFSNASTSPETLMWLGLGVLIALAVAIILWFGSYKESWASFVGRFKAHRGQYILCGLIALALLIFAVGVRVDLGPITLLNYVSLVPDKIYDLWTAFRAAAREAWPFYYMVVLAIVYWLMMGLAKYQSRIDKMDMNIDLKVSKKGGSKHYHVPATPIVATLIVLVITVIHVVDIANSPSVSAKRDGFRIARTSNPEFQPIDLLGVKKASQKHVIALDEGFRGDQSGFYIMGRTALQNQMTLNTGFFARVPEQAKTDQAKWRNKVKQCQLSSKELRENLFFTKDKSWLPDCYDVVDYNGIYILR